MNEEIELAIAQTEGRKPEAERVERIAALKTENAKLIGKRCFVFFEWCLIVVVRAERYESEAADKARYKKELRATKKIAKVSWFLICVFLKKNLMKKLDVFD